MTQRRKTVPDMFDMSHDGSIKLTNLDKSDSRTISSFFGIKRIRHLVCRYQDDIELPQYGRWVWMERPRDTIDQRARTERLGYVVVMALCVVLLFAVPLAVWLGWV